MKATLIISTEYRLNQPSVFIYCNARYYGCLIYPKSRDFPTEMDYWRKSTCSDADRYFTVKEVEYSDEAFDRIKSLQNNIIATQKKLKADDKNPWIPCPKTSKNSKEYKEYIVKKSEQEKLQRDMWAYNAPFERIIYSNRVELRKLILSVFTDEN